MTERERLIAAGIITPWGSPNGRQLTADEMEQRGFTVAAHARRERDETGSWASLWTGWAL